MDLLPAELFVTTSPKKFAKKLRPWEEYRHEEDYLGLTQFVARTDRKPLVLVYIRPGNDRIATCIHEAVHVWQYCTEYMCEDKAGREIEAYAIQKIAMHLLKKTAP